MGIYLNPGNQGFQRILNGTYIDKTGLIHYINQTINTSNNMVCVSRPRRFGKSFAAMMLCAYYDCCCDSKTLFDNLQVARMDSGLQYLNKMDVIYLDITYFLALSQNHNNIVQIMQNAVIEELKQTYPDFVRKGESFLPQAMADVASKTGRKFYVIIDEWDAIFREKDENQNLQLEYLQLLRGMFKGGMTTAVSVAGAYLTGILPIKKYGTQSAMTDFNEFSMAEPDALLSYMGFLEKEVKEICNDAQLDFEEVKRWYDGYSFDGISIYNPNSVMKAAQNGKIRSYWTKSETYESLRDYIRSNFDGLRDTIIAMLGGSSIPVEVGTFQNDMTSLRSKDDVLTLLIHLGYLSYDEEKRLVHIPNLEVTESFRLAVRDEYWGNVGKAIEDSDQLLQDTIAGNEEAVAKALERIHSENSSILQYNDENSLACALTIAFFTARNEYQIIREIPTGKGFADLFFRPLRGTAKPAILVELKYDESADTAMQQIIEKHYGGEMVDYLANMLLVGINYDKKTKKHTCKISRALS